MRMAPFGALKVIDDDRTQGAIEMYEYGVNEMEIIDPY